MALSVTRLTVFQTYEMFYSLENNFLQIKKLLNFCF